MTDTPTTAAGRKLLAYDFGLEDGSVEDILAIEAEARRQDGSALRGPFVRLLSTMKGIGYDSSVSSLRNARQVAIRASDEAGAALAALPPSAPLALDAERLARAICTMPDGTPCQGHQRSAARYAAEYARLQDDSALDEFVDDSGDWVADR